MRGGHRALVALSALAGGATVVGADALVKAINLGAGRMPLGVVTALLGGPVFLLMLRRLSTSSR
jgi:iron complex transport system permease protein